MDQKLSAGQWIVFVLVFSSNLQLTKTMAINIRGPRTQAGGTNVETLLNRFTESSPAKISYYGAYPAGTSACSLDPIPPLMNQNKWTLAAVSKDDFLDSLVCGTCLKISIIDLTTKEDPDDIHAAVVDQCNDCKKGEISLYIDGKGARKANYEAIDCMGGGNTKETLQMVTHRLNNNNTARIQIRNSLLPVVSLECFLDGRWICLPRATDNYFVLDQFDLQIRLQFRVTSITGEKIGFAVENFQYGAEIAIKHQFTAFRKATRIGKKPNVGCSAEKNVISLSPLESISHGSSTTFQDSSGISKKQGELKTEHFNSTNFMNKSTKGLLSIMRPANGSFCKEKLDGTYLNETDCERFVLCVQGRTLNKQCPNGLRYNAREGVCDWARNVNCSHLKGKTGSIASEDTLISNETDEDIYTRKFMGKKKPRVSINSSGRKS